jgi:hypothetical protein
MGEASASQTGKGISGNLQTNVRILLSGCEKVLEKHAGIESYRLV